MGLNFNYLAQKSQLPIIDIHLHAYQNIPPYQQACWAGEPSAQVLSSPENVAIHIQKVLDEFLKNNIELALISSTSVKALEKWRQPQPELFTTGIQTGNNGNPILSPDSLKLDFDNNQVNVL
jgi:hypothetical protein